MNRLTREAAMTLCGAEAVNNVNELKPDFARRDYGDRVCFIACVTTNNRVLIAHYYQKRETVNAAQSLDELSWSVDHYSIV